MKAKSIKLIIALFSFLYTSAIFAQDESKIKEGITVVYENIFSTGNFSEVDKYISADIIDNTPDEGQGPGLEGLKEAFKMFREAFPDLKFRIIEIIVSGNKAAIHSNITGTNTGMFMRMPATNKKIDYNQVDIVYFNKENKAIERWGYFDIMKMMNQLGMK